MRRSALIGVMLAVAVCCRRTEPPGTAHPIDRVGLTMGSELRISAWMSDDVRARKAIDEAFREFDRLDALMSVWKPGSDLVRLNEAAGEHPVQVSDEMIEVFGLARQVSEWTGGKFDVTFGALSDLWKFDQDQDNRMPDPEEVRRRLLLVDYRELVVDEKAHTAFLTRKGMRAHLGGIGKGYAVERAANILRSRSIRDFLIQAGGDLYVGGKRGDRPWRLGVNDPRGPAGKSFGTIELTDATFSTSGDYERFFMNDGKRYHHIIDPATGEPARGCRSVTIVAESPALADALSTGVFLLGPSAGMALVERLPKVEAVIVSVRNEVFVSSGLKSRFVLIAPPTDAP